MKKHICIGDIHGRNQWKDIVKKHIHEDVIFVFVGDYFDSFDISIVEQIANFSEIIEFKKQNLDSVVLLLGNHDFHYLQSIRETYSGFNGTTKLHISQQLYAYVTCGLIKVSYSIDNYLFSHAGVSKVWCENLDIVIDKNIAKTINTRFLENMHILSFTPGKNYSNYGNDVTQTPIWIRPSSLEKSAVPGFIHIVGHTELEKGSKTNKKYYTKLNTYKKLVPIDRLVYDEYLVIDTEGKLIPENI